MCLLELKLTSNTILKICTMYYKTNIKIEAFE